MYIPKLTHYLSADFEKSINGKSSLSNSDIPVISEIIGLIYENSNDAAFTLMNLFTFFQPNYLAMKLSNFLCK